MSNALFLLAESPFSLPLTDNVLIFSVVLFIIFFVPMALRRTSIPPIIGMIIVGALIGPNGFNLLLRDKSIELFGEVGLLYIMFMAALEVDLEDFKRNKLKSSGFAAYTFSIPMIIAFPFAFYLLGYPLYSAILIASIFSSHTLISYPIVSKYEITRNRAVNITVGGTMITDIAALMVLAVIIQSATGGMTTAFWIKLLISLGIFALILWQVVPRVTRFFFKKEEDNIQQYIFVLGIVFLCAFLAEAAGMEAIIGAFLGGLALNKFIPRTSPLMNRIEFIGNALFIPFFLIGVGMLVNFRTFFQSPRTLLVAAVITILAVVTKYLAALASGKTFSFSKEETRLMFGLSSAQAAATLAVVTIGYNVIVPSPGGGAPVRLLDEAVLNGAVIMILITCAISSVVVNNNARKIAQQGTLSVRSKTKNLKEKILLYLFREDEINELVELALLLTQPKASNSMYSLHVVQTNPDDEASNKSLEDGKKLLEKVAKEGAGSDQVIEPIVRYDVSIATGAIHTMREKDINLLLVALEEGFYWNNSNKLSIIHEIIYKTNEAVFVYRPLQPLGTVNRMIVLLPPYADQESGFDDGIAQIKRICRQTSIKLVVYGPRPVLFTLQQPTDKKDQGTGEDKEENAVPTEYKLLDEKVTSFQSVVGSLEENDMLVIFEARKGTISHQDVFESDLQQLAVLKNNYLLLYPEQEDYNPLSYFEISHGRKMEARKPLWRRFMEKS